MEQTEANLTAAREPQPWDVIVIGAGAAGMMAAATAARNGRRVLLLEKMEKSGRKIRISGKGRCNLTNARPPEEFAAHIRTHADFFAPAFAEFNNLTTMRFFERRGVKLETERGERVFPRSGKAWDIANALLDSCIENGVRIEYECRVAEVLTLGNKVYGVRYYNKRGYPRKAEAPRVVVATGGMSYPATGSTGDGYHFAADLGHTIEPVRPSLTPLKSDSPWMRDLQGVLLRNVRATLTVDGHAVREEFGEIGFSERGIEGAVALRVSRDAVDALIDGRRVAIALDLKPALSEEMLRERIRRESDELGPEGLFSELLRKLVPMKLVYPLSEASGIRLRSWLSRLEEADLARLTGQLKHFELPVTDYAPFEYAVVTAGGVNCDEVDPKTLQSRKVKGLYFAGEVLDLDADTGGYNLQIAFSTGRLAGQLRNE